MSKSDTRVAKRYAKALFDSCQSSNFDSVQSALFSISAAVCEHNHSDNNASVNNAFTNPGFSAEQKANWLKDAIKDLCPEEEKILNNFILTVVSNGRINLFQELADNFAQYVSIYKKLLTLEIISAKDLNQQESDQISDSIKNKLPQDLASHVSFQWQTDSELIAGMQVKIGDKIIDGSVRSAINKIARQLRD